MNALSVVCPETVRATTAMTAFRNIAIHEYRELDLSILRLIAEERWQTLVAYCRELGLSIKP